MARMVLNKSVGAEDIRADAQWFDSDLLPYEGDPDDPELKDTICLVARMNNSAFLDEVDRIVRTLTRGRRSKRRGRNDSNGIKVNLRAKCLAMSKTILLDWRNMDDGFGGDAPYNQENALFALTHYHDFRRDIEECAEQVAEMERIEIDGDKNVDDELFEDSSELESVKLGKLGESPAGSPGT